MTRKNLTNALRVKSPCTEDWNAMTGNNKVRFCSHCDLNVNNISEMTRREALRMVRGSDGRICVRYIQHPKTKAPVFADRLYQITRRTGVAAGVLGASLAVSTVAYAQGDIGISSRSDVRTEISQTRKIQGEKNESGTARISGTVTDETGAVIPGAVVSITGKDLKRTVSTNDRGDYLMTGIPAGEYTLTIESSGFQTYQTEVSAVDGRETTVNKALDVMILAGAIAFIDYQHPLLRAVSDNDFEEVNRLILGGTDVNVRDENYEGITALFVAVEHANIKMVETLLNFGARVDVRSDDGRTPLMAMDYSATPELVNLLLRYNARFDAIDKEGNNLLHHLATNENPAIIQIIIKQGVDINLQNEEGQTPLMIAAYYENLETVKALLTAGARVNLHDKEDETALSLAKGEGAEEIVKLLKLYGAREN